MPTPTISWAVDADGNWGTTTDWRPPRLPNSKDNVSINTADLHTVTYSTGADTVRSLVVGNDDFVVSGGSLTITNGASFANQLDVTGGSLGFSPIDDVADSVASFAQSGGTVSVSGARTLTVTGAAAFSGTLLETGYGTTLLEGSSNLASGADLCLDGDHILENKGTLTLAGLRIDLGKNPFGASLGGGLIKNDAGATIDIQSSMHVFDDSGTVSFENAGILEQTGTKGTTVFQCAFGNSGTLTVQSGTIELDGRSLLQGTVNGAGAISLRGSTLLEAVTFGGSLAVTNTGALEGNMTLGDASLTPASFVNATGGAYDLTDGGIGQFSGGTSLFTNAGLVKLTGERTSTIGVDFNNTGSISIDVGTLQFNGAKNNFAGTIGGDGTLGFGGGSSTLATGLDLSVGTLEIFIGTVILGGSRTYAGSFFQGGGRFDTAGFGLTLTGPVSFSGSAAVTGGGTLTLSGDTTISVYGGLEVGGTEAVTNTGVVTLLEGALTIGDSSNSAATFTNASGGIYEITEDGSIAHGTAQGSLFTNAGQFEKVNSGGTSHIKVDFTNSGTILVSFGILEFGGPTNSFAGSVKGAGTVAFSGGVSQFDAGLNLTVANVTVAGTTTVVNVEAPSLYYAHLWSQSAGTLNVAAGDRINFTGSGDSFAGTLAGAGTVALTGGSDTLTGTHLSVDNLIINTASVTLAGTIDLTGRATATTVDLIVAAGGASLVGGGTLVMTNLATNRIHGASASAKLTNSDMIDGAGRLGDGTLTLVNTASGIIDGNDSVALTIATGVATIVNAGTIEATAAGGVIIDSAVNNTGTLAASGGNLTVNAAVTGAGTVHIGAGTADFASTFTENVSFTGANGVLELAQSQSYTGKISGFSKTGATALDLLDIAFSSSKTKATFSGGESSGVLTVTDGAHVARIILEGDYLSSTFTVSSDGRGGTKVVDPGPIAGPRFTAVHPTHRFIAAAASFGASSAGPVMPAAENWRRLGVVLAMPGTVASQ